MPHCVSQACSTLLPPCPCRSSPCCPAASPFRGHRQQRRPMAAPGWRPGSSPPSAPSRWRGAGLAEAASEPVTQRTRPHTSARNHSRPTFACARLPRPILGSQRTDAPATAPASTSCLRRHSTSPHLPVCQLCECAAPPMCVLPSLSPLASPSLSCTSPPGHAPRIMRCSRPGCAVLQL